jgi:hypothetical protein
LALDQVWGCFGVTVTLGRDDMTASAAYALDVGHLHQSRNAFVIHANTHVA